MAGTEYTSKFGLSSFQLVELMAQGGSKGAERVAELGGVEAIADRLGTNTKAGISNDPAELEARKQEFGLNYIPPVPPKSFLALAFDAVQDKTLIILIVAALVSLVLGVTVEEQKNIAWIEGAAILAAVFLVVVVTAINDWTKERQFRGLQNKLETDAKFSVLREKEILELPLAELVVGDIAKFKYGNALPVDGILVQGFDVKVDEAAMTGEGEVVKKSAVRDPMLYAGTQVKEGSGTMLVTAVGEHSKKGMIFKLLTAREEEKGCLTELVAKIRGLCCRCIGRGDAYDADAENPENEDDSKEGLEIEVRKYDPDEVQAPREVQSLTEGSSNDSNDGDVQVDPLQGWDRLNLIKRFKKRKELKVAKEAKLPQKEDKKRSESNEASSVLQKKLNKLAIQIEYLGTGAAILCILVLTLKYVIEEFAIDGRSWDSSQDFSELLHFVIIGITVLVVAVPEGLPLAVTIALAFSVKKMLKDNNLVRHLHACETMGNATTICSDKTGTLTTNRMTVVESYFAGTKYDVTPPPSDLPENLVDILKLGIAINSSYTSKLIVGEEDEDTSAEKGCLQRFIACLKPTSTEGLLGQGLAKQIGNVTECALLGFLVELGFDYEAIREEYPEEVLKKVFTFNSKRKRMSTVMDLPGGGYRVLTKGAPDIVLDKCTHILGENGRVNPLSKVQRGALKATIIQGMASNALRTICIAYRDIPAAGSSDISADIDWDGECEETVVANLTCVGIVGIQDPVRPEVPSSIRQCQEAGITVRMVTGDFPATAYAIAEKCGIITKGKRYLVLEGSEFNKRITDADGEISQEKLDRVWPRLRVLARSSPTDKHTLVNGIIVSRRSKSRQVVAVTGDGTNDAPALKRADVGFAMGIAGTDVAKEASDIILTDDNFASIVKAVKWGRNVYDSISKFIQFQLTVNVVAVTLAIISAFSIGDTPLRAVQLLWVNLIMDTLASLALATESPTDALLKRKPYGRTQSLISRNMWTFILGHSLYQLTIMFILVYAGPELFDIDDGAHRELRADPTEHFTIIFNTFVLLQIFNEVNARKIHGEFNVFTGIFSNYIFLSVMVGQVSVQALIVEFGSLVFSTSGLSADLWLWCVFLGSTSLLWGQVLVLIVMPLINKIPMRKVSIDMTDDDDETKARLLWVKSLQRVRTQIRVVQAFRAGLEQSHKLYLSRIPNLVATPRGPRYVPTLEGKETAV